jgi:hypothetical protein
MDFRDLPVIQSIDVDTLHRDLDLGGCDAKKLTLVCAGNRVTCPDLVSFGDQVMDLDMVVREGSAPLENPPLAALEVGGRARVRIMIDEVVGEELVCYGQVTLIPDLISHTLNDLRVRLGGCLRNPNQGQEHEPRGNHAADSCKHCCILPLHPSVRRARAVLSIQAVLYLRDKLLELGHGLAVS